MYANKIAAGPTYSPPVELKFTHFQKVIINSQLSHIDENISQETTPDRLAALSAKIIAATLTRQQAADIHYFRTVNDTPYLILRNIAAVDGLPPTPTDDASPAEAGWRPQASVLLGLLHLAGVKAASFADEMGGRLCHMVMPAKNSEKSLHRSTKTLNFHTEVVNGYASEEHSPFGAPLSPAKFGLICLRNPQRIATTALPMDKIVALLSPRCFELLQQPLFAACSQSSFDRNIALNDVPVLIRLADGNIGMRYSGSKIRGVTPAADAALDELRAAILTFDSSHAATLAPGDALLVNNRICLHGRAANTGALFDGNDRWLIRIYGYEMGDIDKMRFAPGSSHVMLVPGFLTEERP